MIINHQRLFGSTCDWRLIALVATVAIVQTIGSNVPAAPPGTPPGTSDSPTPPTTPRPSPEVLPADAPPVEPPLQVELPDAQTIISAAREVIGEREAIDQIQSFSLKAALTGAVGEFAFHVRALRSGAFQFVQSTGSLPASVVFYDGTNGWTRSPDGEHALIDEPLLTKGVQQFEMMFPVWFVLFPNELFKSIETVEQTNFQEVECYKVRMAGAKSPFTDRFAYFEVEEKRLRGMSMVMPGGPADQPVEFHFDGWKQVGNINIFSKVVIHSYGQQLTMMYRDMTFNTVDASLFEQPAEVKELLAKRGAEQVSPEPQPVAPQ